MANFIIKYMDNYDNADQITIEADDAVEAMKRAMNEPGVCMITGVARKVYEINDPQKKIKSKKTVA